MISSFQNVFVVYLKGIHPYLPTAREGNVFTGVCLSTIGLMDTGSVLGLVTARSVRILLECFLVETKSLRSPAISFEEHQSIEAGEIPYT